MFFCDGVDCVHFAANACIMHRDDCFRLFRDGVFNQFLVDVHRVRTDVHKHAFCTAHGKSIGCRDERERRHDDFVTGLDVAQKCGHLKSVGATCGEQCAGDTCFLFQPGVAFLVELPIAADSATFNGLPYIINFRPHEGRLVKRNFHCSTHP